MKQVCERCHGVLSASKQATLESYVEVHEESCPSARRIKSAKPVVVPEPPRKRTIPRQRSNT